LIPASWLDRADGWERVLRGDGGVEGILINISIETNLCTVVGSFEAGRLPRKGVLIQLQQPFKKKKRAWMIALTSI
jgi:hypothetical protein